MKRITYILLTLLFIVFAAVQYNDPDPLLWILIYGAMAALCILAIMGKYYTWVVYGLMAGYVVYMGILTPGFMTWLASENKADLFDDIMKMQFPYIEETREFLGLAICVVVLLGLLWDQRRSRTA